MKKLRTEIRWQVQQLMPSARRYRREGNETMAWAIDQQIIKLRRAHSALIK